MTDTNIPEKNWKRMSFQGNKVWVALTSEGLFLTKKNKVLIKYNLKQDYEYWIKKEHLKPLDQAVPAKDRKGKEDENGKKDKKIKTSGKPSAKTLKPPIFKGIPDNCIQIYTDGASSGNPGPSGIGALLIYRENRKEISQSIGIATNNIAELFAIKIALSHLKRHDLPIRVFSDSSYAIGVLTKGWKPQANKEIILEIKDLMLKLKDIKFIKVQGHAGIKENEVADFLATSAIKKGPH